MTLNNFEKQLKKKLDQRKIQPSKRAWDEISAALTDSVKPRRSPYLWYGIAAGFIGILLLSVIYFNAKKSIISTGHEIVDTPVETIEKVPKATEEKQELAAPVIPSDVTDAHIREEVAITQKNKQLNPQENTVVAGVYDLPKQSSDTKVTPLRSELIIDTKLAEVIAQVALLENDKVTLTDAEVDSLLRKAQEEILTDKLFRADNAVDASALLSEVEDELNQSFRDQIFEKLKTGFIKVRTAVADRNN